MGGGEVEPRRPHPPDPKRSTHQRRELARPGGAAVTAEAHVLDAVELEQLEGLGVVTGRDDHLVPSLPQALDDRAEHEGMRRRRDIHPQPHG